MAGRLIAVGLVVALVTACAPAAEPESTPPASDPSTASHEFQRAYDRALRDDPISFLTTIDAHYLAPGDTRTLDTFTPSVRLDATEASLTVDRGDSIDRFDDHGELPLDDRHTLTISRQDADWRVLVHDHDAPARLAFTGIAWFPVDPALVVEARYQSRATREATLLQTSRGLSKTLYLAGEAEFELAGAPSTLLVFGYQGEPSPGEPLLIPFRDASSGTQTYAAGRYLELDAPTGDSITLDFNRATNPLCAYSEHYNCPMPPQFNLLPVPILAGAKAPH